LYRNPRLRSARDRRLRGRAAGQSAVELALLLPLLLLIVFGVLDLGRAFQVAITIANAARVGARYAMQYPTDTNGIIAAAQAEAQGSGIVLTDPSTSSVSVSCPQGCGSNQPIQVTVTYTFTLMIASYVAPNPIPMSNSVQMLVP
jgi:Flp pilus assembly protein TadG